MCVLCTPLYPVHPYRSQLVAMPAAVTMTRMLGGLASRFRLIGMATRGRPTDCPHYSLPRSTVSTTIYPIQFVRDQVSQLVNNSPTNELVPVLLKQIPVQSDFVLIEKSLTRSMTSEVEQDGGHREGNIKFFLRQCQRLFDLFI